MNTKQPKANSKSPAIFSESRARCRIQLNISSSNIPISWVATMTRLTPNIPDHPPSIPARVRVRWLSPFDGRDGVAISQRDKATDIRLNKWDVTHSLCDMIHSVSGAGGTCRREISSISARPTQSINASNRFHGVRWIGKPSK